MKGVREPKYQILIEVQFNDLDTVYTEEELKAYGEWAVKQHHISDRYWISDLQLQAYYDLIGSILNLITGDEFERIENYESLNVNSYNIQIKPEWKEKKNEELIEVLFRLSDHLYKSPESEGKKPLIHTVIMNHGELVDGTNIIQKFRAISKELKGGNYANVIKKW